MFDHAKLNLSYHFIRKMLKRIFQFGQKPIPFCVIVVRVGLVVEVLALCTSQHYSCSVQHKYWKYVKESAAIYMIHQYLVPNVYNRSQPRLCSINSYTDRGTPHKMIRYYPRLFWAYYFTREFTEQINLVSKNQVKHKFKKKFIFTINKINYMLHAFI